MCVLAIIAYSLLGAYELIPLYKQKLWRDFWANIALGGLAFTITLLLCFDVKVPSPEQPIREFIISLFGK